jgi:hypothetical protein
MISDDRRMLRLLNEQNRELAKRVQNQAAEIGSIKSLVKKAVSTGNLSLLKTIK